MEAGPVFGDESELMFTPTQCTAFLPSRDYSSG